MRKSIFLKVLFEKRRSIALWTLVIFATNTALAFLFPAMRDTMGAMTESIPPGMEGWFGDTETWQTYTGYAGQELFGQMAIFLIVMAILFGSGYLAGYEGNGTLLTLLSRPVSRSQVYWSKYAAFVAALAGVSLAFYAGVVAGGWLLGEPVAYGIFAECMLMVSLISLALGSASFAIGAITGKSGLAGISVGFYAFVAYLVSSLSTAAEVVNTLSYASLFRYATASEVIAEGLRVGNVLLLIAVAALATIIGNIVFKKRDLITR